MINSFNRSQLILGIINLLLGTIAFFLCYLFFSFAIWVIADNFLESEHEQLIKVSGAVSATILIAIYGFLKASRGEGHDELHESNLALSGLDSSTGGSHAVGAYARQVTGPAYILTQVFLAGPLQYYKGFIRFKSMIPSSLENEEAMVQLLSELKDQKGWHDAKIYRGRETDLSRLIKVGKVEFSARKGRVRLAD